MKLYDRITQIGRGRFTDYLRGSSGVEDPSILYDMFEPAVQIDIDNVSQYIYSSPVRLSGLDISKDIPAIAGPFPHFWLEWSVPQEIIHPDTSEILMPKQPVSRLGMLFESRAPEDNAPNEVAQVLEGWMFGHDRSGRIAGPFLKTWVAIDGAGQPLTTVRVTSLVAGSSNKDAAGSFGGFLGTPFMAIGFMHCKNVVLADAPDTRTRQQRRYDERKGTKPTEFKTLVIDPMKQVLETEGGIEQHGLKKALHICRGHFATYSEDRPLFGKYSGTFWKPAHVRGSADVGMVGKDYKVKAPKQEAR